MVYKMLGDTFQFITLLGIFLLAYGVATQAIFYPNEWRFWPILNGMFFKPYFNIYGEIFIGETIDYPLEDELSAADGSCSGALYKSRIVIISPFVHS